MKKKLQNRLLIILMFLGLQNVFAQSVDFFNATSVPPKLARYDQDVRGDILVIGNNIINRSRSNNNDVNTQVSTSIAFDGVQQNNNTWMKYIDIDGDPSTFSSSSARLQFPVTACQIKYAALYWGALYKGTNRAQNKNVRIKKGTGAYVDIVGTLIVDQPTSGGETPYAYYADVTSIANGSDNYTVADIEALVPNNDGEDRSSGGLSAGWSMFVVYEDFTQPTKSITLYDGYKQIGGGQSVSIPVSGFRTIPVGPVRGKLAFGTLEGDQVLIGESYSINTTPQSSQTRPVNNLFNASINKLNGLISAPTLAIERNPNSQNTFGYDTGAITLVNSNNTTQNIAIANNASTCNINMSSAGDFFGLFFTAISLETIAPRVVVRKSIVDNSGQNIGNTTVALGAPVNYILDVNNIGNDTATFFTITDVLPINVNLIGTGPLFSSAIQLPPVINGQPITYTVTINGNGSQTVVFRVPSVYVVPNSNSFQIRIRTEVIRDCNALRDACSNRIENSTLSSYGSFTTGTIPGSAGFINNQPSFGSVDGCGNPLVGPAVFLGDRSGCNYNGTALLCGNSPVSLTAANGYTYSWSGPSGSAVNGLITQTVNVNTPGTYTVIGTAPAPCTNLTQVFVVSQFNSATANPFGFLNTVTGTTVITNAAVNQLVVCQQDLSLLAKIFLCGINDTRLIQTGLTNYASIRWQKLDTTTCSGSTNPNCPAVSALPSCWINVGVNDSPNFLLISEGSYRMVVQYQNGCGGEYYFDAFKNNFNATYTAKDFICNFWGSITLNGVPAGYEYSLSNTGPWQTSNIFNQTSVNPIPGPGNYNVYIRQIGILNNPCIFEFRNIGIRRRNFTADAIVVNPLCSTDKGRIEILMNDVEPNYTYQLFNGSTTTGVPSQQITNSSNTHVFPALNTGQYTILATTQDGCSYQETLNVVVPNPIVVTPTVTKAITCYPGEVTMSAIGGTNSYTYTLNGPGTNVNSVYPIFTINSPGTYTVIATDGNYCVDTAVFTVAVLDTPLVTVTPTNVKCFGEDSGQINLTVTTNPGYIIEYYVDGIGPSNSLVYPNLFAGDHVVEVRFKLIGVVNDEVCSYLIPVNLSEPDPLDGLAVLVPRTTCTAPQVINIVNVTGGTTAYTYDYENDGIFINASTSPPLQPGSYTPRIQDANGCFFDTNPITIPPFTPPTNINFTYRPITCDSPTTAVTLTTTGGQGTLNYSIIAPSNPASAIVSNGTNNIFNVGPGSYTFQVTDAVGCIFTNTLTILPVTPILATAIKNNDVVCFNTNTGAATVNVSGFTNSYTYQINGGTVLVNNTATIPLNNLAAGTYNIRVTDTSTGCFSLASVTILQPAAVLNANAATVAIKCSGPGSVTINATGGWGNNTYTLITPALVTIVQSPNNTFLNLTDSGTYTYSVRDLNGCTYTSTFSLTTPIKPVAAISAASSLCYSTTSPASITINATGGSGLGYQYSLNGGNYVNSSVFGNLTPGTYCFTVRDSFGCASDTVCQTITPQLTANAVLDFGLSCKTPPNGPNGQITVNVTGGTPNYRYRASFNGTAFTGAFTPIVGTSFTFATPTNGTYAFQITDSATCITVSNTITVQPLVPLTLLPLTITNTIKCFGDNTGAFTAQASGGQPNYTYSVQLASIPFTTYSSTTGLPAGTYSVTVTDANACTAVRTITLSQPDSITFDVAQVSLTCSPTGTVLGSITVQNVIGGSGSYVYTVVNNNGTYNDSFTANVGQSNTFSNLGFGIYTVTVTDTNGCSLQKQNIQISSPPSSLTISATPIPTGACAAGASVNVVVGGSLLGGPFHFAVYQFVPGPLPNHNLWVAGPPADPILGYFDEDAIPLVPGDKSHLFTGLETGSIYTFIVFDESTGCYFFQAANTATPTNTTISVTATPTNVTCMGAADGNVSFTATGFQGSNVTYQIFNVPNNSPVSALVNVSVAGPLTINNFGALAPGRYIVRITETNGPVSGCSAVTVPFDILQSVSLPQLNVLVTKNDNCNVNAGILTAVGSFGAGNYTYLAFPAGSLAPTNATWDFTNDSTNGVFNLESGTYDIYVRDAFGCIRSVLGTVLPLDATPTVTIAATPSTICNAVNGNYSITVNNITGVSPFSYQLNSGAFLTYADALGTFDIPNLSCGTYTVTIRDVNGCTTTSNSITINCPLGGSATPTILATANCNIDVANVTVNAIGGTGSYEYLITPGSAIYQASNVFLDVDALATPYVITIRDTNTLCTYTTTVSVALGVPVNVTLANLNVTNVSCSGASDGVVVVNLPASNTEGPYIYTLTGGTPSNTYSNTTGIFNSALFAGPYTLNVRSSRGCVNNVNFGISQNPAVFVNASVTAPFACNGTNTPTLAQVTALGGGGTGAGTYTYSIPSINQINNNTGVFQIIDNGAVQTLTVFVKDQNNCTSSTVVVVNPLNKLDTPTVTESVVLSCSTTPGQLTVSITGGSGNYFMQQLPSGAVIASTGSTNFALTTPGNYDFLITDSATGCTKIASFTKDPYQTMQVTANTVTNLLCFGDTNGTIAASITNYTGNYNWEVLTGTLNPLTPAPYTGTGNTSIPLTIPNLSVGSYVVAISQTAYPFCTVNSTLTVVGAPNTPVSATVSISPVTCNNSSGVITVNGFGGTGTVLYQFTNVSTGAIQLFSTVNTYSGLGFGNYLVQVMDSNLCTSVIIPVNLPAPIPISYTSIVANPVLLSCIGNCNASITVNGTANGFGSGYLYTLNNLTTGQSFTDQPSNVFNDLCAGTYNVTIRDPWSCSVTTTNVTIAEPALDIKATLTNPVAITCAAPAQLSLFVEGGTPPYTYSNSSSGPFVAVPFPSNTVTINSVPCGDYTYYVRDVNLCKVEVSNSVTVQCIDPILLTLDTTNSFVTCAADTNASVSVTAIGGLGNYTYSIYNASTNVLVAPPTVNQVNSATVIFSNLSAGNYYVIVTGNGGCSSLQYPFRVTAPLPLTAVFTPNPTSCIGQSNGSITVVPSGGVGPYQYINLTTASQAFDKSPIEFLPAGCYAIQVIDANNCTFVDSNVCIVDPTPITYVTAPQGIYSEVCLGDGVTVNFEVTGGRDFNPTVNYTLVITQGGLNPRTIISSNGQFNFSLLGSPTDYDFVIYAGNVDCSLNSLVTVNQGISINPVPVKDILCANGLSFDQWTVTVPNSFNAPITDFAFQLDNAGPFTSQNVFVGLSPGTHIVNVRYLNSGCTKFTTITFNSYTPLNLTVTEAGLNQIGATTTGGTPNYSYTIDGTPYNFATPYLISQTGNYLIEVTDANGCTDSQLFFIKYYDIKIPNFFTPNGDNNNSTWQPLFADNFPDITYEIYDRYGRKLIILTYGQGWDGKYENLDMPSGDYWYIVKLNSPADNREFVGNFTLYR